MTALVYRLRSMVPRGRAFTGGERADAAIVSHEAADEIEQLRAENARLLCLMAKAHAVMQQTGWQLAPASVGAASDGILELAAAEIESEFASVLK